MWHVKLNNINEAQFDVIKYVINDRIYCKPYQIDEDTYKEYYLVLENQEVTSVSEALTQGKDEIKILASILNNHNYKNNITVDFPCEIHAKGTKTIHFTVVDKINISDVLISIHSNNTLIFSEEEEKKKSIKNMYLKSKNSQIKKQLLIYMDKEKNWINAYKIYEILKHYYKKEKELKKYPELSTFGHTANSPKAIGEEARHAIQKNDNPKNIANLQISYKKLLELAGIFLIKED